MAHNIRSKCITFNHSALLAPVVLEHEPEELPSARDDGADGTNLRLWPTALVLSEFLCEHPEYVAGKRVVELGSGSGAVGLVCSALGAASVTLTDVGDALPLIARNVHKNEANGVRVAPCLWGNEDHISCLLVNVPGVAAASSTDASAGLTVAPAEGYDVVICCEVIYQQPASVLDALARTQQRLAKPGGIIMLAYEFRNGLSEDIAYFDVASELFGDSITHQLNNGLAQAYMDGQGDDGNDDRFLYIYKQRH